MAKRLSMRKIAEVLRLHHECSSSQRDIALAVGVSPTTVGEYVRRAKSAGIGYPLPAGMDETALQAKLFPARPAIKAAPPDPDWAIIHQELARKHVTRELLWQEYKAEHPEGYRYSAFCERYRAWAGKLAVSMRQTHRPGEKLFVDYAGTTLAVIDPSTGAITHPQANLANCFKCFLMPLTRLGAHKVFRSLSRPRLQILPWP
jgi:transposase